ncbi:MAG TPA: hypothetical protein VEY12_12380 [Thermoplasmata archaeon]|nr:hypothetical protein [Thermoplasmata archaeon]
MMRWLLYAASGLVALAGFQFFVLTEQTATTFAWTVQSFLTAASLGAAYWSAVPVEFLAARERTWANARIAVPGVWTFTTLTLILTAVHASLFHFTSADAVPRAAAYLWLGIYAGVPVAMLVALFLQTRKRGRDPPGQDRLPSALRFALLIEGTGTLVVGLALFVIPDAMRPLWPWSLTTLTARAIGAWLVGIAVLQLQAFRENEFSRIRPMGAGIAVFGVLELIALARYPSEMAWSTPGAWLYLIFLASLLSVGVVVCLGAERFKSPSRP